MSADPSRGRFEQVRFESEALRGNALGDPPERPLWVYLPPGYDEEPERRYPAVYVIQGMTGMVGAWFNVAPFQQNYPALIEQLAPACLVVLVDAFTSVGGSQFVDSPAVGRYHTYLCDEIVPWVDRHYRTLAAREHRGIQGKSSGGYGAMISPVLRPDLFGGLATHAGDALFECCYALEFPQCVRALRDRYDGSWERFWEDFRSGRPVLSNRVDPVLLNTYAMAACYSSNEDGSIEFPFDLETGELVPDVWERWLRWDPVRRVADAAESLRTMRAIWVDAGTSDEYFLDLGATAYRRALATAGVPDGVVHFELFDGKHGGITWRYPLSLRFLAERLA
ncbi:MAG TPA: alpha/beta hydrolase-fold protein [Gaiellaceae bacterium]